MALRAAAGVAVTRAAASCALSVVCLTGCANVTFDAYQAVGGVHRRQGGETTPTLRTAFAVGIAPREGHGLAAQAEVSNGALLGRRADHRFYGRLGYGGSFLLDGRRLGVEFLVESGTTTLLYAGSSVDLGARLSMFSAFLPRLPSDRNRAFEWLLRDLGAVVLLRGGFRWDFIGGECVVNRCDGGYWELGVGVRAVLNSDLL